MTCGLYSIASLVLMYFEFYWLEDTPSHRQQLELKQHIHRNVFFNLKCPCNLKMCQYLSPNY